MRSGEWRTIDRQANAPDRCQHRAAEWRPDRWCRGTQGAAGRSPGNVRRGVTEKLMMYAVNRQLEYFDMPQVRAVVRGAAKDNYKLSSIVLGIVNTDAFRKQGPAEPLRTRTAGKSAAAK